MVFRSFWRPTIAIGLPVILGGLIMLSAPAVFGQGGLEGPAGVEVTPASRTLDTSASVRRIGTNEAEQDIGKLAIPATKTATLGWTTIFFDNIEGAFPGPWSVYDQNPASGLDYWDDVSCFSYTGSWSAWCADEGNQPDCTNYDNDMDSWMIYGPFSLANAQDARALFAAWSEVEDGFDGLFVGASINGTNFYGSTLSQDFGWSAWSFDFTNVTTLGDLRGYPSVWFGFKFESDVSITYRGVYLDDILIEKNINTGGCTPNSTTLCLPADNRFRVSVYFQTTQGGGQQGDAGAIPLDSIGISKGGIFYFNDPANPEFLVKVLNACASNNRYWVFYAATTNVGFTLTVTDTLTNQTKIYSNPDIHPATTVTDTQAFATCP